MENLTIEVITKQIEEAGNAFKKEAKDARELAEKAQKEFADFKSSAEAKDKANDAIMKSLEKDLEILSLKLNNKLTGTAKEKAVDLVDEIKAKKADIQKIVKGHASMIEIKANTLTTSIEDNEVSFHLPNIGQLGVKQTTLYDVLPKINVPSGDHNGTVSYIDWDEDTTVRAASALDEAEPFNESTAKFKYYKEPLKKIGDILPVSEEFGEDAVSAAAELNRFLQVNVAQERSRQLAVGDGTGNTFKGLINRALPYTATAAGISEANLKDLVRKMRTAIVKTRGSKYSPDIVVMNSDTYDKYYLAKDLEGQYLFDENGRIAGLTVVEDNFIPDNELVVGDRRFAAIYQMSGIILSEGYVGDQFGEDLKSIKARTRLMMLIREVDRTGFLHCSDIEDALVTLELPVT